ncbi:HpcH/HpaI aldolase/citrate lyase family protein [Chitinasiproducens palmae]|uniref:Citrate lyase subunit beta / citryl-CoA lyase n=1 Tax=Chitinasiproducens palmae TaxID=1770053 RepID=A0A1H2PLG1_9BURK|nr:CoA ester lyase [Chitinasiproducens palmae]SDV47220.1 citrate lyase subunit beta / citryl-CoA lyase [Chitinasiproducens palmae]
MLFVPADRPERFEKALASGADAVILDLEDAVAPDRKPYARQRLIDWLGPGHSVLVRINAPGTPWFGDDVRLGRMPGVAGIVLPKADSRADVLAVVRQVADGLAVYPLIESAKGMRNVQQIAAAPSVRQLVFGSIDFCADLRMDLRNHELNQFRAQLALASRVAGIEPPIDGVTTAIDQDDLVRVETVEARRWGFAGKLCIHPRQVAVVNQAFLPNQAERDWAARVIAAFAAAHGAAVAVDGKMVDRPVVQRAQAILDAAGA